MAKTRSIWVGLGTLAFLVLAGCQNDHSTATSPAEPTKSTKMATPEKMSAAIHCVFEKGQTETVHYTRERSYKTWVEMGGTEPQVPGSRKTTLDILCTRHVDEVMPDGAAVMSVTLNEAKWDLQIDTTNKKTTQHYVSTADTHSSDWPGQPSVAGATYQIVIGPDSVVREIRGVDQIKQNYKLGDTPGVASELFTDQTIRQLNERTFVKELHDKSVPPNGLEVLSPNPEATIKAKAIRRHYTIMPLDGVVTVMTSGEPAYTAPDDFPQPDRENIPPFIIELSDLDKLNFVGSARMSNKGQVLADKLEVDCVLTLNGEKISSMSGSKANAGGKEKDQGFMYTQTTLKEDFEVVKK